MKKQKPLHRGAGILLSVSSLPEKYGVGTLGAQAYGFVDFLASARQRYWQMLPLGPTGYGDSPYQSFSAFAGNPYFIDLDTLRQEGLLTQREIDDVFWGDDPMSVDYPALYAGRFPLLRKAVGRFSPGADFADFCKSQRWWLTDYAMFMALKIHFEHLPWNQWPREIRLREREALAHYEKQLLGEIEFWRVLQYWFACQWKALRQYAQKNGVLLIGDIPIYVSPDSADAWAFREQFLMDEDGVPTVVAGVPPDCFSKTGQLWGNPIYNWAFMEKDGFSWWKRRMSHTALLFDLVRLDHFLGYVRYYAIPGNHKTAELGQWQEGPGEKLLDALALSAGDCRFIAEDLGVPVPAVQRLLRKRGYPNMKVLQFAFDSGADNTFLPHHYSANCVVYGGTHDNDTQKSFFQKASRKTVAFAKDYLHVKRKDQIPDAILRAGYASVGDTCIFQMQDILGLGSDARMNLPSTLGNNWKWRLLPGQCTQLEAHRLRLLAETYGRAPVLPSKKKGAAEMEGAWPQGERSEGYVYL